MAEVKLVKVSKIYQGTEKAVNSVDIHVNDKEFVVLVGPSGCGTSTTLRMIAGLEERYCNGISELCTLSTYDGI